MPTGRVVVWYVAVPDVTVTGLPMSVEPTANCTVPAAADGLTVAVKVTLVPVTRGLAGATARVVVVGIPVTTKVDVPVEPE